MEMSGDFNKTEAMNLNGIVFWNNAIICYQPSSITTNGVWQDQNPLSYSLPLFILQLMIIVITTQVVMIILKPLRQPRVILEIISGLLLGPSGFGGIDWIGRNIFPLKSVMVLETMANIGLLYYLFLVGVEMDVSLIRKTSRETLSIAAVGLFFPLAIYLGASFILETQILKLLDFPLISDLYQGVTISFTAFPVLSRILAELKLFNTDMGRNAMCAALVVDILAWFLVTVCLGWGEVKYLKKKSYVVILGIIGFVLLCVLVIRPIIMWIINRTPEGEKLNEFYICVILTGVMICSFITDAIGTHSMVGAFAFGLIIPNGQLGTSLLEKLEDFVVTLLLPLFFTTMGIKTDINYFFFDNYAISVICIILLTNVTKVLGTFLVGLYFDMQMHQALSLGLLMNTKGIIDLIVLNVGRDLKFYGEALFTIMVISMIVVTTIATPAIAVLYKTSGRFISYKRMTIQKVDMDAKMKILMCMHTPRDVPAMINLLEVSHATKRSPIDVYALHLVELTRRASTMVIVHNASVRRSGHNSLNDTQLQSEQIVKAFKKYAQEATNTIVQSLTTISPYPTMHEEICNLAEDKIITLIIAPFHKKQTVDGSMEVIHPAIRNVNRNLLANAPCSVGILIDRGLGGYIGHISVIFVGGPDDREALAYGWRMAEHPGVNLSVMRFILTNDIIMELRTKQPYGNETLKVITDMERETQLDNEYIAEFRLRNVGRETITYKENMVNNAEETVLSIRSMDSIHNFFIVGRGQGFESSLIVGFNEFSENPELGPIGDLLASSEFATSVSILVVQQYVGEMIHEVGSKVSSADSVNPYCRYQE